MKQEEILKLYNSAMDRLFSSEAYKNMNTYERLRECQRIANIYKISKENIRTK